MTTIIVRRASENDINAMSKILAEAFGVQNNGSRTRLIFEIYFEVQPDGCYVAVLDDEVVGTGCFYLYNSPAWIGAVAVTPRHQRKGIGTLVMKALLEELKKRGILIFRLDVTEAGYQLYKKLGFLDEYRTIMYSLPSITVGSDTKADRIEILNDLTEEVLELDRKVFGYDRSRVLRAWIIRGVKLVVHGDQGFAMVYKDRIGPVIAEDKKIAKELILYCYAKLGGRRIIVPEANRHALQIVNELNAQTSTVCVRMRLGPEPREDISKIFGILNYAKG